MLSLIAFLLLYMSLIVCGQMSLPNSDMDWPVFIRIYDEREDGIEKSVPRVAVWNP